MKYWFVFISFILTLVSCSDLSKGEQLKSIETMNRTLDSVQTVLIENKIDTLSQLLSATMTVEMRIKNNYFSDTIDLELGKKMDAFKILRRSLEPLETTFISIGKGVMDEKEILKKLQKDIDLGNGAREKYDEYVLLEQNKVDQLRSLLKSYVDRKNETMSNFDEIYNELNAFSQGL